MNVVKEEIVLCSSKF